MRRVKQNWFRLAAPAVVLAFGPLMSGAHGQVLNADQRPPGLQNVGIDQKLGAQVPLDAEFTDEQGRTVRLGDYFGRQPVVLVLAYYECPMLCTEILNGVLRAIRPLQFDLGEEYRIVTVSIDPGETAQMANDKKGVYVKGYGRPEGAAGWHFLTGPEASIQALADAVGFRYRYEPETDLYSHASAIQVLTPEGKVARYFFGVEYSPRDLRLTLVEAASGRIGTPVDQVLLYCFRYDPALGRYSLVIMNVLRIAALLTLLGVVGMMIWFLRAERAKEVTAGRGVAHR